MNPTKLRLRTLAFTVLLIAVTACVSTADFYQEPELRPDQVATLQLGKAESYAVFSVSTVRVFGIDGVSTNPYWKSAKILPGRHSIYAVYIDLVVLRERNVPATVKFEAEAGVTYQIRAASDENDENVVRVWVEEVATETVVGMTSVKIEESD